MPVLLNAFEVRAEFFICFRLLQGLIKSYIQNILRVFKDIDNFSQVEQNFQKNSANFFPLHGKDSLLQKKAKSRVTK